MLKFIVLGQIPGTHLQITVAWFVFAILGLLIWTDIKFHSQKSTPKHRLKTPAKKSSKAASRARA